jgi:hypothetical protein
MPVRALALLWAALQLVSPGASAIADGKLASQSASAPSTHVEATTTTACPVVHSPDCGVCRYLSTSASTPAAPAFDILALADRPDRRAELCQPRLVSVTLHRGRAPPTV